MLLSELIDIPELGRLIDEGLVKSRKHPTLPLTILGYTPAATGASEWGETLSRCRGLIYDHETLQVAAIPFKKFWNYGDTGHGAGKENLPEGLPKIYEKVDGSLGIGFFYRDEFIIATRGSFESDQAKWANEWVKKNLDLSRVAPLAKSETYLFEIVYPQDKKVVDYSYKGLVLLGSINNRRGDEFSPEDVWDDEKGWLSGVRVPVRYDYEDLEKLQAQNTENAEGFVCVWYNLTGPAYRVKLKFETYCLLHKLYFQTSTTVIWDLTRAGKSVTLELQDADQALKDWAGKVASDIQLQHDNLRTEYTEIFRTVISLCNLHEGEVIDRERRKLFAMYATRYEKSSLLFTLFDGKLDRFEEMVWEAVKPVSKQYFRKGIEED